MNVTLRLFARARDLAGTETVVLEVPPGATIGQLRQQLIVCHPALEKLAPHLMFAVGTDYVDDEAAISAGTEVAAIPPVSGG